MAIESEKVFDPRAREVRLELREATGAYKAAIAKRDAMIIHLANTEGYGTDTLVQLFQVKPERIKYLLTRKEQEAPGKPYGGLNLD